MEHCQRELHGGKAEASRLAEGLRELTVEMEATKSARATWRDELALIDGKLADVMRLVEGQQAERQSMRELHGSLDVFKREVRATFEASTHAHNRLRELVDESRSSVATSRHLHAGRDRAGGGGAGGGGGGGGEAAEERRPLWSSEGRPRRRARGVAERAAAERRRGGRGGPRRLMCPRRAAWSAPRRPRPRPRPPRAARRSRAAPARAPSRRASGRRRPARAERLAGVLEGAGGSLDYGGAPASSTGGGVRASIARSLGLGAASATRGLSSMGLSPSLPGGDAPRAAAQRL